MNEFKEIKKFEEIKISSAQNKQGVIEEKIERVEFFEGKSDDSKGQREGKKSRIGAFFEWAIKIGLYALAFLMPLFFLPQTADVLEFNKLTLLFVTVSILFIFWVAKVLVFQKLEIRRSFINILIVVFIIAILVSSLLSENTHQAMLGIGGVISEGLLATICLALVYFLVSNSFKKAKEFLFLFYALIGSAILSGVFAFLQLGQKFIFPWDFARLASFNLLGSYNFLSIFLAGGLILSSVLFAGKNRVLWQRIFLAVVSALLLIALIILNSSNAFNIWWGITIVMALVVVLGILRASHISQPRLILPMLVLGIALLLGLTKIDIGSQIINLPNELALSYKATLSIDKMALSERPFFGSGPGTFYYNWGLYKPAEINNDQYFWNVKFFQGGSKIFSLPITLGAIGAFLWLLMVLFFIAWGAIKLIVQKGENWILAFAFYSGWLFLAIMQFLYPTNLTLEFLFWLTLGASLFLLKGLKKEEAEEKVSVVALNFRRESPLASVFSFFMVILIVLAIAMFYVGGKYWRADQLFQQGISASSKGNLERGYNLLTRAAIFSPARDNYQVSISRLALLRIEQALNQPKTDDRDKLIQNLVADAINSSKRAVDISPLNSDNWLQRGIVFRTALGYVTDSDKWMIEAFSEASRLQPKSPYALFELGRSYLSLAQFTAASAPEDKDKQAQALDYVNKAQEQFNQAVALKNDYADALYQQALIYDQLGSADLAIAKMETIKIGNPNDIGIAFQLGLLYYKKQDSDKAQAEFERAVLLDANYSNARYFLGLIYEKQNEKLKAIEQFQKIADLNPDNQEVKKILDNLQNGRAALEGIVNPAPEETGEVPIKQ